MQPIKANDIPVLVQCLVGIYIYVKPGYEYELDQPRTLILPKLLFSLMKVFLKSLFLMLQTYWSGKIEVGTNTRT